MSHSAINRQIYEAKFKAVEDAALRLSMMLKSPYRRHRKEALAFGKTVAKVQDLVTQAQGGEDVPE